MRRSTPRTALVTGATSGIGFQTALHLARANWTVLLHGRDRDRVTKACAELRSQLPGAVVEPVAADLASLEEALALPARLTRRVDRLDALVNNAGLFLPSDDPAHRRRSVDGHELTWAVNYLAAFTLTAGLPAVFGPGTPTTVVNLSSGMHLRADLAWDDVQREHHWDGRVAYAQSKLALTMFSAELAGRLPASSTVFAISPGYVDTKLVRGAFGGPALPVAVGGWHVGRLLTDDPFPGVTGQYVDQTEIATAHPLVTDPAARRRLWRLTERQTGQRLDATR